MTPRRLILLAALVGLASPSIVAAQQAETIEYYATDAIGSIRIVYDGAGNVIGRQDFTPYGTPVLNATSMPKEGFGGTEKDDEAQQMYFHARSLAGRTGRFGAVDPVFDAKFEPQRWNRYEYALNNPLVFVDPTGLDGIPVPCQPGSEYCVSPQCPAGKICRTVTEGSSSSVASTPSTTLGDIMAGISYLASRLTDAFTGTVVVDSAELVPTPHYSPSPALQTTATVLTAAAVIASPVAKSFMAKEAAAGVVESVSLKPGTILNRVWDSRYTFGSRYAGPKGGSFTPGDFLPISADAAIADRGLGAWNNAQVGAVFQVTEYIPAISRTSQGGIAPEIFISPTYYGAINMIPGSLSVLPSGR